MEWSGAERSGAEPACNFICSRNSLICSVLRSYFFNLRSKNNETVRGNVASLIQQFKNKFCIRSFRIFLNFFQGESDFTIPVLLRNQGQSALQHCPSMFRIRIFERTDPNLKIKFTPTSPTTTQIKT